MGIVDRLTKSMFVQALKAIVLVIVSDYLLIIKVNSLLGLFFQNNKVFKIANMFNEILSVI